MHGRKKIGKIGGELYIENCISLSKTESKLKRKMRKCSVHFVGNEDGYWNCELMIQYWSPISRENERLVSTLLPNSYLYFKPRTFFCETTNWFYSRNTSLSKNIRSYKSDLAMASVRANFFSRGVGNLGYNPTLTVHGRLYHDIWVLNPPESKSRAKFCLIEWSF